MTQSPNALESSARDTESVVIDVARRLGDSVRELIAAVPGSPARPMQLTKTLGLNKVLASRLLSATRTREPLAIAHLMPGPEALKRLVAAARKKQVPADILSRAEVAIDEFEGLIRDIAGDRAALDGIIGAWLPDAREKTEALAKQAMYRGASVIKGCASQTHLSISMIHPCADGKHHDGVTIENYLGVRRLSASAVVKFSTCRISAPVEGTALTLDGEPIESSSDVSLPALCTEPVGHMTFRHVGDVTHFVLDGDGVGAWSAVNLSIATLQRCCLDRYRSKSSGHRKRGAVTSIHVPTTRLIMDTLLHDDVFPGSDPTMVMYDASADSTVHVNDPAYFVDRLSLSAQAEFIGHGPESMRVSEFPRYVELIEHVCERRNWDPSKFRAYRCQIAYPVYGSRVLMVFDAPLAE